MLEGMGEYKGKEAYVEFQNENLLACVDGEILATVPDLICIVDAENLCACDYRRPQIRKARICNGTEML